MKDEDLEALLRAYRPPGPPPELRARVVASAELPRRPSFVLEWLPTAAALMFTWLFYWLSANQLEMVASHFEPVPPIDRAGFVTLPPAADYDR
jgi:hypothetical protein